MSVVQCRRQCEQSLEVAKRERLGQQLRQRRRHNPVATAHQHNLHVVAKLGQHLPASTARSCRLWQPRDHGDRNHSPRPRRNGCTNGAALRTDRQAIARVLNVATDEHATIVGQHRGTDQKLGGRRVAVIANFAGFRYELLLLFWRHQVYERRPAENTNSSSVAP